MKLFAVTVILAFVPTVFAESPNSGEFVTQLLEPTGGKIVRPKDWFYAESHRGPVYLWTISAEDSTGGKPYTTGVRIQTFVGVQKGTGKTAEKFLADFVASKKNDKRVVVIKTCERTKSGLFNRICLETEEGDDHIHEAVTRPHGHIYVHCIAGWNRSPTIVWLLSEPFNLPRT